MICGPLRSAEVMLPTVAVAANAPTSRAQKTSMRASTTTIVLAAEQSGSNLFGNMLADQPAATRPASRDPAP